MSDKLFPEDDVKTQLMVAPPPQNSGSDNLEQTRLFAASSPESSASTSNAQAFNPPPPVNPPPPFTGGPTNPNGPGNSGGSGSSGGTASGRAITALILAIASFFCCGIVTAIPALILGRMEESAINRGESAEAGRIFAKIGWVLGLVSIVLTCVGMMIGLFYVMVAGVSIGGILQQLHLQSGQFITP